LPFLINDDCEFPLDTPEAPIEGWWRSPILGVCECVEVTIAGDPTPDGREVTELPPRDPASDPVSSSALAWPRRKRDSADDLERL
jgi:hypothetical protein